MGRQSGGAGEDAGKVIRTEPGFPGHIVKGDLLLKVVADIGDTVRDRVAAGGQTPGLNCAGCGGQQAVKHGSDPPGHVRLGDCASLAEDIADILECGVNRGDRAGSIRAGSVRAGGSQAGRAREGSIQVGGIRAASTQAGNIRVESIWVGMSWSQRHGQYYVGTLCDFLEICPCQYAVKVEPDC